MRTIKVGFSKSKARFPIVAWLIMLAERSDYSHTYLKFPSEKLEMDLAYHAVGSGVNFMGPEAFDLHHKTVSEYLLEVSDEEYNNVLKWCARNSGKDYGKLQILGIAIKRAAGILGLKVKNPFSNGDHAYVCSEAVFRALRAAGQPVPDLELDSVGLRDVRSLVESLCSQEGNV